MIAITSRRAVMAPSNIKSTESEVLKTERTSSLGIYVERKTIRHACIENKPHTDQIIKLVCGLINLQSGVVSEK